MRISDWSSDVCSSDLFVASWLRANPINVKGKVITTSPRYLVAAFALIIAVILLGLAVGAGWTETADWQISRALSLRIGESSRSEEPTSELQSLMRISYAGFCLKKQIQSRLDHASPMTLHATN